MSYDKPTENHIEEGIRSTHHTTLLSKKQQLQITEVIETQLAYLKSLATLLENRQAAESIRCVVDYKKDLVDGSLLCVRRVST